MTQPLVRRFPYTAAALAVAIIVLAAGVSWHINVFEWAGAGIIGIEQTEIGEIAMAFLLVIPAFFVDRVVARERKHEGELRAEQLRVLRMTMRTVQHIVNNNLNQLQLLLVEMHGHVAADTLTLFDEIIIDTAAQLTALANMEVVAEQRMEIGAGLDVSTLS